MVTDSPPQMLDKSLVDSDPEVAGIMVRILPTSGSISSH